MPQETSESKSSSKEAKQGSITSEWIEKHATSFVVSFISKSSPLQVVTYSTKRLF